MDSTLRSVVIIVLLVFAILFLARACEKTGKIDIRQKSNDERTTFSVDIHKKKAE